MALLRLSRRREGAERRGHVARPRLDLPRHLLRARPGGRGTLTEEQAQEIIDDFVIKLRIVRFLRTPEYDDLFAGDPDLGDRVHRRHGRRRPAARHQDQLPLPAHLYNLGPAPEPNLTIWYSPRLPESFRQFAAKVAIDTSSIQFESDEIMRVAWGDDGAIACCVSPMLMGKQMQFFGARANLAKCLLYAINGGRDEISGKQVGRQRAGQGRLPRVRRRRRSSSKMMDWLAGVYVNAMNVIHYMHDKYAYERIEMALHDYAPVAPWRSASPACRSSPTACRPSNMRKVKVDRDETGLVVDYETEGEFPKFGNNDNRVDHIAAWLVSTFMSKLRKHPDLSERDLTPSRC